MSEPRNVTIINYTYALVPWKNKTIKILLIFLFLFKNVAYM